MRKLIATLSLSAGLLPYLNTTATASHFRYGSVTWARTTNTAEVVFDLTGGFRRSGYTGTFGDGRPQIGDVINESVGATEFEFGDGAFTPTLDFVVTAFSPAEDWLIARALQPGTSTIGVRHTYASAGPFTAGINSSARIAALNNGANGAYIVQSIVTPLGTNLPPVSTLVPIVTVPRSSAATFLVPASDPNGDVLRFRLATTAESGASPSFPTGLSINPATGLVTWNNIGLNAVNFWTTQVIIEDLDNLGNVKSHTPVDFLLKINTNTVNNTPSCSINPPGPLNAAIGVPISFSVTGNDTDAGDVLTINGGGLPTGATMIPSLPTSGSNGVTSIFNWTPGNGQTGPHVIQFSITDLVGAQSLCTITINVLSNLPPHLEKYSITANTSVTIGEIFQYEITFNTFSNTTPALALQLIDFLPNEVGLISFTTNGAISAAYDFLNHAVVWNFGTWPPLSAGPTNYVTVQVLTNANFSSNILNHATLYSSNLPPIIVVDYPKNCVSNCPPGVPVSPNRPPVAVCTNVVVAAGSNCTANASIDNGSFDPDAGDTISIVQIPPGPYPIGSNNVCLIVTDNHGASNACCSVVLVVDTTPPTIFCPTNIVATNAPGQCSAVVGFVVSAADCALATLTTDAPTNSVYPVGITTVTATAVDVAGNTNTCSFTITVLDTEAPLAACRPAPNPSDKKIPVAGKNPKSGQNPDGYFQLLGKDNCDAHPSVYLQDNASGFIAGPFNSGDIIKLKQSPGGTPSSVPGNPPIAADIRFNGDGLVYAVDASGNVGVGSLCLVPPPPK